MVTFQGAWRVRCSSQESSADAAKQCDITARDRHPSGEPLRRVRVLQAGGRERRHPAAAPSPNWATGLGLESTNEAAQTAHGAVPLAKSRHAAPEPLQIHSAHAT
jgi:hypothetical protein